MEAEFFLRCSSPSQRQARPSQIHSSAALHDAAVDAPAASRQLTATIHQHELSATVRRNCDSAGGGASRNSSCLSGLSRRRRCCSASSRKSGPLVRKLPCSAASTLVYPPLMARRHVFLVVCFLLCAGVTSLEHQRLTGAEVVTADSGECHSKGGRGSRKKGRAFDKGETVRECNAPCRSKGRDCRNTTNGGKVANTSRNGNNESRVALANEPVAGDNVRDPTLSRPRRPANNTGNAASVTAGDSGPIRATRSVESSHSNGSRTAEHAMAEGFRCNRCGVSFPPMANEERLRSQEERANNEVGRSQKEGRNKEVGSVASLAEEDEEHDEVFELAVGGQPLATEESQEAISFSSEGEESTEAASAPLDEKCLRRRPSSAGISDASPEQYFSASESLFESLYKKAKSQMQEEEQPSQKLHEQVLQEGQQDLQSSRDTQQRPSHSLRLRQPNTSGASILSFDEGSLLKLQTSTVPIFATLTRRSGGKHRSKTSSLILEGSSSTIDTAAAAALLGGPDSESPGPAVSKKNSPTSAIAAEAERGESQRLLRYHSAPAGVPLVSGEPREENVEELTASSKIAAQGQPETHAHFGGCWTTEAPTRRRRPRVPSVLLHYDGPAPDGRGTRAQWSPRTPDRFPAQAPAAEGVNDQKAATEHRKQQGAAPTGVLQQQQQPHKQDGNEVPVLTPEAPGGSPRTHRVSKEGGRAETPQQQVKGWRTRPSPQEKEQEGTGEKPEEQGSGGESETKKFDVPSVLVARRAAERWEPCGRWTNFVFIFVNPMSGDGTGAQWVARADANGHYQTHFRDICTRVHIYNLRHGEGGASEGFQLLRRVAAAKHVLSVVAGEEAKLLSPRSPVASAPATALGANGAGAAGGKAGAGEPRRSYRQPNAIVRAIAVGGDGTVSWVNRAASEAGIQPEWIAIGVVGFGTGNDFAQSYGWGNVDYTSNIFKGDVLKQYVLQWQRAQVAPHDVWRINVKTSPNGYFEHIDSTTRNFKKILCQRTGRPSTVLSGFMTLYFGIGFEALVGLTFDMSRSTSRLRNRMLYGVAFLKHLNRPWRLVTDQIESVYVFEDNQKKVLFTTNPFKYSLSFRLQPAISVTFIGTETILGGAKVWAHSRRVGVAPALQDSSRLKRKYETFIHRLSKVKQDMGDGKLEVMAFRDRFSLMRSIMYEQNAASRLMQHPGPFYVKFYPAKVSGPVPFQVDGEFFLGHNVIGAEVKHEKKFYVLRQAPKNESIFKVSNIVDVIRVAERPAVEIDQ